MGSLYVTEQGTTIRRDGNRFVVERDRAILAEVHDFKLDRVVLFGNVQITTQAMSLLLDRGIDTTFLSLHGRLKGRLSGLQSRNVALRVSQFDRLRDPAFCLGMARAIVNGKISNASAVLGRHARNHPEVGLDRETRDLERLGGAIATVRARESLLGLEGQAASVYFTGFGRMLRRDLAFTKRSRRPPRDPANAMLSFGYTMLYSEAIGALAAIGFDPYVGVYHSVDYGRCSLALDLIEEFRPVSVDRLVLQISNLGVLKSTDFEVQPDGGVWLGDAARRRFLSEYERLMTSEFTDCRGGARVSMRSALHAQAQGFRRAISTGDPYVPFAGWR